MTMLDGGLDNRRGTEFAIEIKRMAAFIDAPTIVFAALHELRRFPKVLTVVADPDPSALFVNRQPTRVSQTVGPILRSRIFQPHERIVLGHRVRLDAIRVINVNTKYAAVQMAQIVA